MSITQQIRSSPEFHHFLLSLCRYKDTCWFQMLLCVCVHSSNILLESLYKLPHTCSCVRMSRAFSCIAGYLFACTVKAGYLCLSLVHYLSLSSFLSLRLHLSRDQNHKVSCGLLFSSDRSCCGSFCCILALQETAQR